MNYMMKLAFLIMASKDCLLENGVCRIPRDYVGFIPEGTTYWKDLSLPVPTRDDYFFFNVYPEDFGVKFGDLASNFLLQLTPSFVEWIFTCGLRWVAKPEYGWIWPIICKAYGCEVDSDARSNIKLIKYDKTLINDPEYTNKYEGVIQCD